MTPDPWALEARERLADGRKVLIRAIRPGDRDALQAMVRRLSPESAYLRFFQAKTELSPAELDFYTGTDFKRHVALAAVVEEQGVEVLIGTGRYFLEGDAGDSPAELSFVVDDAHRGLGVATLLLRHLAGIARASGIAELRAEVISDNTRMLDVLSHAGLPARIVPAGPMMVVRLSLNSPER